MNKPRHLLALFFTIVLLTIFSPAFGAAQPGMVPALLENQPHSETTIDGFPVVLDGQPLLFIQRGFGPFSAEERAYTITRRLQRIARDDSIPIEDLKIVQNPYDNTLYISVGNEVLLTVMARDAQANRSTPEAFAQESLQRIKAAVARYRADREPEQLLRSGIYALLASVAFLAISMAVVKVFGRMLTLIEGSTAPRTPETQIRNVAILTPSIIGLVLIKAFGLIRLLVLLALFFVYSTFVLRLFPWTRVFGESVLGQFYQALELALAAIGSYLPNVFMILVIALIAFVITRAMKIVFAAIEREDLILPGFYADWAKPTYSLLLAMVIVLATVLAFPYLPGFDSPSFRGISVFLGLLVSLGSTSAITNIVGGVIFIYTRAFRIGDHIQIGDVIGDIIDTNFLAIRICTPANQIITIPNSTLLSNKVINYNIAARELNRYPILQTTITLGYDLPWRKVHTALIEAALDTEHILKRPAPFVLQVSLDNHYISYQLNAYTDHPSLMVFIHSELHQNIQDKCNEAGIEILSPNYTSLRDGNATTIPEGYVPSDYAPPAFRLEASENPRSNKR